jgi:hypothetical protein
MINKVNLALDKYQQQLTDLFDGKKILEEMVLSVREIVQESITTANNTVSIDERMDSLVKGLQSILVSVNSKQENFYREQALLEIRIATIEDLLLQDIEEDHKPDSNE